MNDMKDVMDLLLNACGSVERKTRVSSRSPPELCWKRSTGDGI